MKLKAQQALPYGACSRSSRNPSGHVPSGLARAPRGHNLRRFVVDNLNFNLAMLDNTEGNTALLFQTREYGGRAEEGL